MTTLALYLAVTLLCGFLAVMIRMPALIGFLLAGFVLNFINAPDLPALEPLNNAGVTILLFTIGLKFSPLTLIRREVWTTAITNMAFTVGLTAGTLGALSLVASKLLPSTDMRTFLLLGFALSFSSTVLVMKILQERSDDGSFYGRIAIGILVMQDIAAVLFMSVTSGQAPSPWALDLPGLIPLVFVARWGWNHIHSTEMSVLFGICMAMAPGYAVFEAVGIKGDLGSLIMGVALASHPKAEELSDLLLSLKEILLVFFFVSIGITGLPSWNSAVLAVILCGLLPLKALAFSIVVRLNRLRNRTAIHTGVALGNYSEFAIIVAAVGAKQGLLSEDWLLTIALSVALSFALSVGANQRNDHFLRILEKTWPEQATCTICREDQPVDIGDSAAVVLGMGRVGRSAYEHLESAYQQDVVGVENNQERANHLRQAGLAVVEGDATDSEFWEMVQRRGKVRVVVLAMPDHGTNIYALKELQRVGFTGISVAVARFRDEVKEAKECGASAVLHLYDGAGVELADQAMEVLHQQELFDQPE